MYLSVVIPTFNRLNSLRLTLEALARQTYPTDHYELIVVSDGCTDGTDEFLAEYASQTLCRLRPIRQDNAGPARARNRGIAEATGDVIVFLDDDVEPAPELLAAHAAHHQEDDRIAVIGPMLPDPARRSAEPPWIAWEHAMLQRQYTNWQTGVWTGAGPNHFYSGNASVRRRHLLHVAGFDESFKRQEDVELAARMQRTCGVHFVFDATAIGIHRPHRSLASWLAVPYAYGRFDVLRAQHDKTAWYVIRRGYQGRSRVTRLLAASTIMYPAWCGVVQTLLLALAYLFAWICIRRACLASLTVVYNLRYIQGVQDAIGSRRTMQNLMFRNLVPANFMPEEVP
jgi:glycosyltransferase involved in cell wall biosynthesis